MYLGTIHGSRLITPPLCGRVVRLERSTSCAASSSSKLVQDLRHKRKAFPYRRRQVSEPTRDPIKENNSGVRNAEQTTGNVHTSEMPPSTIVASRFRLFPRAGSSKSSSYRHAQTEDPATSYESVTEKSINDSIKGIDEPKLPGTARDTKVVEEKEKHAMESKMQSETRCLKFLHTIRKYLDFTLCCNPTFITMTLSVMCMSLGVPHVLFFMPNFVRSLDVGADPATLIAVTSISELIGRIVSGLTLDAQLVPKFAMFTGFIALSAASVILLPLANSYPSLIIVMAFYGIGVGSWFLMVPLLLADFFGVENIGSSYGLMRLFQSMSNLCGPLAAGVIKDATGSFAYAFHLMGSIMSLGTVFSLLLALSRSIKDKKDRLQTKANIK